MLYSEQIICRRGKRKEDFNVNWIRWIFHAKRSGFYIILNVPLWRPKPLSLPKIATKKWREHCEELLCIWMCRVSQNMLWPSKTLSCSVKCGHFTSVPQTASASKLKLLCIYFLSSVWAKLFFRENMIDMGRKIVVTPHFICHRLHYNQSESYLVDPTSYFVKASTL